MYVAFVYSSAHGGNLVLPCCGSVAWPQIVHFKTVWAPDGLPPSVRPMVVGRGSLEAFSQIPYQYQSSDGDCLKRMESSSGEALLLKQTCKFAQEDGNSKCRTYHLKLFWPYITSFLSFPCLKFLPYISTFSRATF